MYFVVAPDKGEPGGGGGGGAHLTQEHLAAALLPAGELKQALISKVRPARTTAHARGCYPAWDHAW